MAGVCSREVGKGGGMWPECHLRALLTQLRCHKRTGGEVAARAAGGEVAAGAVVGEGGVAWVEGCMRKLEGQRFE